jgi:predicted ester cyclase
VVRWCIDPQSPDEDQDEKRGTMSTEANREISRRVTAALNARDWAALKEVMAPELAAGFAADPFLEAFPDIEIVIDDQLAEGDRVANRWRNLGTHTGVFMGIAPTGKRVSFTGISIDRIAGGKVVESWMNWDELGLLRQLGATTLPG